MMETRQILVCNHCTLGCCHCPYSTERGEDYYPETASVEIEANHAYILTGGEPLESPSLSSWIRYMTARQAYFRIATGGFVPLDLWMKRLKINPWFLGFNIGTDIVSKRVRVRTSLRSVWLENWRQLSNLPSTWLTLTVGTNFDLESSMQTIDSLKPHIALINSLDEKPESYVNRLFNRFPGVIFIDGYSPKS